MTYTVRITPGADSGHPEEWQASIDVPGEGGHPTRLYSVGPTPADALHRLAHFWMQREDGHNVRPQNDILTLLQLTRREGGL